MRVFGEDSIMNNSQEMLHCSFCQKKVTYHIPTVNHRKEFIRTLCSLGFWLPFWLLLSLGQSKVCDLCGNPLSEDNR